MGQQNKRNNYEKWPPFWTPLAETTGLNWKIIALHTKAISLLNTVLWAWFIDREVFIAYFLGLSVTISGRRRLSDARCWRRLNGGEAVREVARRLCSEPLTQSKTERPICQHRKCGREMARRTVRIHHQAIRHVFSWRPLATEQPLQINWVVNCGQQATPTSATTPSTNRDNRKVNENNNNDNKTVTTTTCFNHINRVC